MDDLEFQRIAFEQPPQEGTPDFWKRAAHYTERQCDAAMFLHLKDCKLTVEVLGRFLATRTVIEQICDYEPLQALKANLEGRAAKIEILLKKQAALENKLAGRITPEGVH